MVNQAQLGSRLDSGINAAQQWWRSLPAEQASQLRNAAIGAGIGAGAGLLASPEHRFQECWPVVQPVRVLVD